MKRITIFGASGFLGSALVERLASMGEKNIVAVSRNEGQLVVLREKFPHVEIQIGDIANRWTVKKAMKDADEVYALAALKHIGIAERDVMSCVATNIHGMSNIISESINTKPKVLLFTSTDKASNPTSVYGCSKKIGERLMAEAEKLNPETKYFVCRYGNVASSTGSIITKWKPKMERGEEVILTDPEASRFFFTVDEAVNLIFECIKKADSAKPYTPILKAVKMGTVLEACMSVYGKSPVKIIGLQSGENKVETMDGINFSDKAEQYSKSEFINKFLLNGKD